MGEVKPRHIDGQTFVPDNGTTKDPKQTNDPPEKMEARQVDGEACDVIAWESGRG
jgi:hypothetical protein